jgi:hypothetical protein
MKFAVIGGGIGGLVIAYRLSQKGHIVRLFEKTDTLGGLARTFKLGNKPIEVYYHHYNKGDTALFNLCKELGIKIVWFKAPMGFLSEGKIYDFDNVFDLLKFKPLSLNDKIRFGLELYFNIGTSQKAYEVIWKPLLIQKFGAHYLNVPMTYIYSRPRSNGYLGYMEGSTQVLIDRLYEGIIENKGEVLFGADYDKDEYTAVIDTTPQDKGMLPITCVVLVLDRPFMKYYWLNVGDLSFPFGHLVQKGNVLYLPKYGEAKEDFISHLKRINPDFEENWIKEAHVFKDERAQIINVAVEERGLNKIIAKAEKTVSLC